MQPVRRLLGNLEIPLNDRATESVTRLMGALCARLDAPEASLKRFLAHLEAFVARLCRLQETSIQPLPFLTVRIYEAPWGLCTLLVHRGVPFFDAIPAQFGPEPGLEPGLGSGMGSGLDRHAEGGADVPGASTCPERAWPGHSVLRRHRGALGIEFGFLFPYALDEKESGAFDAFLAQCHHDPAWHALGLDQASHADGQGRAHEPEGAVEIREVGAERAEELAQLFYHVYGYSYVNANAYDPLWLKRRMDEGGLRSFAALDGRGALLGHVGLMRYRSGGANEDIYEPCMGVTDPRVKSKGLFSAIFSRVMEVAEDLPMRMCVFDCVTNIDFSQRLIVKHAGIETALFVGCQSKATQARLAHLGLGPDPDAMERYSLLMLVRAPHGRSAFAGPLRLPESIGAPFDFLLEALKIDWDPVSRCDMLPAHGSCTHARDMRQESARFHLDVPGRDALKALCEAKRELFRSGVKYCAVDIPADARGLGAAHDRLSADGFFLAGLVPYRMTSRLGVRLQALVPTQVGFPQIKVHSPLARRLLDVIRRDYESQERIP